MQSIGMTRRNLIRGSLGALGVGSAYARFVEPGWLQLSEVRCPVKGLRGNLKLLHISDLHASPQVANSFIEHAIAMGLSTKPDLICVTGDFVTNNDGYDEAWLVRTLGQLPLRARTFAVLGNHDGGEWSTWAGGYENNSCVKAILQRSGIRLLSNANVVTGIPNAPLQLAGVGDLWSGDLDAGRAFDGADPALPTVLLAHNPDSKVMAASKDWRLMLSGHTHGGQIVIPGVGLSPAPVWDKRYIAGLKPWRDRWIHVSRGVGNVAGVRFNCRPEVTVIHLTPA